MSNYNLEFKVMDLLEELEDKIENSNPNMFTNKIKIDKDEIEHIIEEIKISLPEEYQHVKWLKEQRDLIIDDAQRHAENLLVDAENKEIQILENANMEKDKRLAELEAYVNQSVEEHEIVRLAKQRAEGIIRDANEQAYQMKMSAYQYTEEMLGNSFKHFEHVLSVIEQNRQEMLRYRPNMDMN